MAAAVQVPGTAVIKVNTGVGDALEILGYSINGVEIEEQPYFDDVPGDERGGDVGPAIENIFYGSLARIRTDMSKWDPVVATKVETFLKTGTAAGAPNFGGRLMSVDSFRLLIHSPSLPRNFVNAWPRESIVTNRGSRWARMTIQWLALADASGLLWNTTTA